MAKAIEQMRARGRGQGVGDPGVDDSSSDNDSYSRADGGWAATDNGGNGPLHEACRGGHVLVAAYLLGMDADIDERNAEGHTPLDVAADSGKAPSQKCC